MTQSKYSSTWLDFVTADKPYRAVKQWDRSNARRELDQLRRERDETGAAYAAKAYTVTELQRITSEVIAQRDLAWQELRDIRATIHADPNESTLDEVRRNVKPAYISVYVLCDSSEVQYAQAVLSDYGAAVNWLDADRENRALLFFALNKLTSEYATSEEPAK